MQLLVYPSMPGWVEPFGCVPYGPTLGVVNQVQSGQSQKLWPLAFGPDGEDALMPVSEPSISGR